MFGEGKDEPRLAGFKGGPCYIIRISVKEEFKGG
jgi:hypothetical protein